MVEPLRHRQTKEAETDMFDLKQPRHTSTLHEADFHWLKETRTQDISKMFYCLKTASGH